MFKRLTVIKNAVYINHDLIGTARGLRKSDRGPAEKDRKAGSVKSAVTTNWTNVIRGPIRHPVRNNSFLTVITEAELAHQNSVHLYIGIVSGVSLYGLSCSNSLDDSLERKDLRRKSAVVDSTPLRYHIRSRSSLRISRRP